MVFPDLIEASLRTRHLFAQTGHFALGLSQKVKLLERMQERLFMVLDGFFRQGLKIVDRLGCVFALGEIRPHRYARA